MVRGHRAKFDLFPLVRDPTPVSCSQTLGIERGKTESLQGDDVLMRGRGAAMAKNLVFGLWSLVFGLGSLAFELCA